MVFAREREGKGQTPVRAMLAKLGPVREPCSLPKDGTTHNEVDPPPLISIQK